MRAGWVFCRSRPRGGGLGQQRRPEGRSLEACVRAGAPVLCVCVEGASVACLPAGSTVRARSSGGAPASPLYRYVCVKRARPPRRARLCVARRARRCVIDRRRHRRRHRRRVGCVGCVVVVVAAAAPRLKRWLLPMTGVAAARAARRSQPCVCAVLRRAVVSCPAIDRRPLLMGPSSALRFCVACIQ